MIHEKSNFLINQQKKNLNTDKILWITDIKKINSYPTLYLANEFFDAIPIKQFFKKKEGWVERFIKLKDYEEAEFNEQKIDIKKIEQNLKFKISNNQNIIEYSPDSFEY
jgi:cyclopropane-fatty-acyl-phospholipid synthase